MKKLHYKLKEIDNKAYGRYRTLSGLYNISGFHFQFIHIQGDPFAAPSRLRYKIEMKTLDIPESFWDTHEKRTALSDYLLRRCASSLRSCSESIGSGKGGLLSILNPGQEILEQNALMIEGGNLELRLNAGLPGDGRRIMARAAGDILMQRIPDALTEALFWLNVEESEADAHIQNYLRQHELRQQLKKHDLTAFVANGSVLARESGDSDKPMQNAVPFQSPESMEVALEFQGESIRGMGVPKGISLIAGGGFHGKSTLLKALEYGIYNHIATDGRQGVVCLDDAVKVRAEDGRQVWGTDISSLIHTLPGSKDTTAFSTANASGSTSQAANLIEALESGSKLILIDEDISAVNFLIRDARMRQLVEEEFEPVCPLVDQLKILEAQYDCSFIMVIGACGDYLPLADHVLVMREYIPLDCSEKAKELSQGEEPQVSDSPASVDRKTWTAFPWAEAKKSFLHGKERGKVKARVVTRVKDDYALQLDSLQADLSVQEQIVRKEQVYGIAMMLQSLLKSEDSLQDGNALLLRVQKQLQSLKKEGLSSWKGTDKTDFFLPRAQECLSAFFRLRLHQQFNR